MLPVIDARITGNIFLNFKFVFQSDYFIVENTKKAAAKHFAAAFFVALNGVQIIPSSDRISFNFSVGRPMMLSREPE